MKNIIKVYYNDLGKELTNKSEYIFEEESQYRLTPEEVRNKVINKVPEQMVQSFELSDNSFAELEVGMFVYVKTELYNSKGELVMSSMGADEILEIDDKYIRVVGVVPYLRSNKFGRFTGIGKNTKREKTYLVLMDNEKAEEIKRKRKNYDLFKKMLSYLNQCEEESGFPYVDENILLEFMKEIGCIKENK